MSGARIVVDADRQLLELHLDGELAATYPVATAAAGLGERGGSLMTPRGQHVIEEKIGGGEPCGAVFVGRRPTGEICDQRAFEAEPDRDWILSRILWLSGCEAGRNLGGDVDTHSRYIYIHGCPDPLPVGQPASHGCIRMRNYDVIELYERVEVGTPVEIVGGDR